MISAPQGRLLVPSTTHDSKIEVHINQNTNKPTGTRYPLRSSKKKSAQIVGPNKFKRNKQVQGMSYPRKKQKTSKPQLPSAGAVEQTGIKYRLRSASTKDDTAHDTTLTTTNVEKSKKKSQNKASDTRKIIVEKKSVGIPAPKPNDVFSIHDDQRERTRKVTKLYESLKGAWPEGLTQYLEPLEGVLVAVEHYMKSLPNTKNANLVVVAESHSRTDEDVIGADILEHRQSLVPQQLDNKHINLVHCISYGDAWLIREGDAYKKMSKPGTPSFWKVLSTMAGDVDPGQDGSDPLDRDDAWKTAFNHVQSRVKREQRVKNKVDILEGLRRQGIVLLDVSPLALFLASGTKKVLSKKSGKIYNTPIAKLSDATFKAMVQHCWNAFAGPIVRELKPARVVVLGTKLQGHIGNDSLRKLQHDIKCDTIETLTHPSSRTHQESGSNADMIRRLRDLSMVAGSRPGFETINAK